MYPRHSNSALERTNALIAALTNEVYTPLQEIESKLAAVGGRARDLRSAGSFVSSSADFTRALYRTQSLVFSLDDASKHIGGFAMALDDACKLTHELAEELIRELAREKRRKNVSRRAYDRIDDIERSRAAAVTKATDHAPRNVATPSGRRPGVSIGFPVSP